MMKHLSDILPPLGASFIFILLLLFNVILIIGTHPKSAIAMPVQNVSRAEISELCHQRENEKTLNIMVQQITTRTNFVYLA